MPHIEEWEESGIVPRIFWKKMGEQGFLCTDIAEEYGGAGGDFLYSVIVCEELAKCNFSGLAASLHSDICVPYITSFASEEQKQKYLPGCVSGDIITAVAMTEPNTGSDLAAIKTTAAEDGDQIILNGQKTFISNGINCDLGHCRRPRSCRCSRSIRPLISTLSRPELPALKKESRSKRSAGTARIRRNCTLRIAGFRRKTASGIKEADFSSS
ncbi:MAG: acyl-CoA dehydrogenase family protein [Desulfobacterales bacterium]|nr:acyl-CoA dehydrogenase family protein [Desulfobacterales bacterium]